MAVAWRKRSCGWPALRPATHRDCRAGVLILVRLKLTLLRRSMTGSRGDWMVAGAVVGTGLAVSTIVLSALYRASPAVLGDLLGVIYAL